MSLINKKNIFGFPRTFLEISLNDRVHHSAHTSHHSAHTPTHHTPIHTYLYTHTLTHRVYLLIMTHKHKNGSSPRLTSVAWLRLPQSCGTYGGIPTLPPATAPHGPVLFHTRALIEFCCCCIEFFALPGLRAQILAHQDRDILKQAFQPLPRVILGLEALPAHA